MAAAVAPWADNAVQEVALPLRHEDIIRQQASEKGLDPALIAGVIYAESHFRDQTSPAGAKGLMQLMPSDRGLHRPEVGRDRVRPGRPRHAAGEHRLRLVVPALPAEKYEGREVLALAAYNAGEGKVDEWVAGASGRGERFRAADHIPFAETRHYVQKVLDARAEYRRTYARELGL